MKRLPFLGKCLVFVALLILASESINQGYIKWVSSQSYIFRGQAQFEEYKQHSRILVLGDSYPMAAVYPYELDGSFILGSQGENVIETYYRLKYYLDQDVLDIRLAIVQVDLHTLAPIGDDQFVPHEFWRKYIDYVELGNSRQALQKFLGYRVAGELAYKGGIDDSIRVYKIKTGRLTGKYELIRGFRVRTNDFSQTAYPFKQAREKAEALIVGKRHIGMQTKQYFLRILNLLQTHHIPVILIRYPVTSEYYRAVDQKMDIGAYYGTIDDILAEACYSIPILDYHDAYWSHPEYFSNSDHLNLNGAKIFTNTLHNQLVIMDILP